MGRRSTIVEADVILDRKIGGKGVNENATLRIIRCGGVVEVWLDGKPLLGHDEKPFRAMVLRLFPEFAPPPSRRGGR